METFAVEAPADWRAVEVRTEAPRHTLPAGAPGRRLGEFTLALAGEHNVRNALAALAVGGPRWESRPEVARAAPPRVSRA